MWYWKFKTVASFVTFICLLFRRNLSAPWSVYANFENNTMCFNVGANNDRFHMNSWIVCGHQERTSRVLSSFF